jgi:hypothetical protein
MGRARKKAAKVIANDSQRAKTVAEESSLVIDIYSWEGSPVIEEILGHLVCTLKCPIVTKCRFLDGKNLDFCT